jgi:glycosyltransferase involved in cell wall biosynthesis
MSPAISIIIPAYNVEPVIAETLASVQQQTFRDFEAIVVDDGSEDRTSEIVRQFVEKDARFILLRQENAGVSAARNAALKRARGELIAFLDADDIWFPEKLTCQIAMFRQDPRVNFTFTNFVFGNGQQNWGPFYRKRKPLPEGNPLRQLISANLFATPTVVTRRAGIVAAGGFDSNLALAEDWDMWLRMAERDLWVRGTRESLVRVRIWTGNISKQKLKMAERDVCVLEKNLHSTRHPEWRSLYERSLARARVKLELTRQCSHIRSLLKDGNLSAVPPAVLRLWFCEPRWKWLRWYLRLVWPKFLGGDKTARYVHQKILNQW